MSRSRIIAGKAVIIIEAKDALDKSLAGIRSKMHKFANATGAIGDTMFRTGFFGSILAGAGLRQFGKFDDLILELQVSMGKLAPNARKVDAEMMSLENTIRELGKSTSYTSVEVAAAAVRLAKAGLNGKQVAAALQPILDLGRGTSTDLETSANIFVRSISAFTKNGVEFNQALAQSDSIVSQFVIATRAGVLDLTDLEAALRYVQGSAGSMNITLAETLAVLTELSNKGLVGSIGGTSLNTALQNLIKKREDIEKVLNIQFVTSPEGDLNLLGTLDQIFRALKNVGSMGRTQILGDIFNLRGTRAVQAASAIDKISELKDKLAGASDQARRSAKIMDSGIGGTFRLMRSAIEDLNISLDKMASGPIIVVAEAIRQLADNLNSLSVRNPLASTLIVLSPAILLGAGLGFMALSKALRIAAVSAGMLKSAYSPLANMLAKGLGGQMIMARRLASIQRPTLHGGILAGMGAGVGHAGTSTAAALRSHNRMRTQIRLQVVLLRQAEYQRRMARIIQRRGVGNPAPWFAAAATSSAQAARAGSYSRMARGARGVAAKEIGIGLMHTLRGVGLGLQNLGRIAVVVGRVLRGIFSLGGLTTIIEGLILFGDRIPIVSDILTRFGQAFSGAFKEIGKVAIYAKGPIEQFKVAFEAFSMRRGDVGMDQLKKGFMSLVDIIGNQLYAAWNRFKEALGPVWDTLRQIAAVLGSTFNFLREIISINLGEMGASLGTMFGGIASLFTGGGDTSFVTIFQGIVKGLLSGMATIVTEINTWVWTFISASDDFIFKLEGVFIAGARLLPGASALVNFDKAEASRIERNAQSELRRRTVVDELNANNKAFQDRLNKAFSQAPSAIASKRAADAANAASRQTAANAFKSAEAARKALIQQPALTPGNVPPQLQPTPGQLAPLQQAKQVGMAFASALVGSAASTRGNVLKFGAEIEKKQLQVLEQIRDDQRKIGADQGVLAFE